MVAINKTHHRRGAPRNKAREELFLFALACLLGAAFVFYQLICGVCQ